MDFVVVGPGKLFPKGFWQEAATAREALNLIGLSKKQLDGTLQLHVEFQGRKLAADELQAMADAESASDPPRRR